MIETPNLIIGSGPAGLAVAGRLRKRNIEFEVIEKSQRVGNAWHEHYDRLHLHTVKSYSHLPHLPFPEAVPKYVPRKRFAEYMENYAQHFNIQPHFGEAAELVEKRQSKWYTKTNNGKEFLSNNLIIATGVNRVPNRPKFKGEELFSGKIIHSKEYKNPQPFAGQKVLVIGMGNTGAEVALDLSEHNIDSFLSVRGPVNIIPREIFGRPAQVTAIKLSKLPSWLSDWIGKVVRNMVVGNLKPFGLNTPNISPAKQLREMGKTPVIDVGTVDAIKAGKIKVLPGVDHFNTDSVTFENGESYPFDSVILATGYRAKVDEFISGIDDYLDPYSAPKFCVGDGDLEGLFFIGFDNYTPGGILGTINRDSQLIADVIASAPKA